ncbi:hypothetical protein FS837_001472 [Tulasnella sp. UAMH 9824]|nr:hypothetical protein FS837_001472 [Tulasnella sp. UAMH 9824]
MEGVRKSVCQVLGVADGGKHSPRLDLVSLVLFGPGTSTYQFNTQPMPGAADLRNPNFGSILVTLPSPHIGGITQINYGASITLYDPSQTSYLGTSVLAWYSSPHMRVQEVVPISAGFRLALRYTLVHTNPSKPVPCLPSATTQMKTFKHALLSWKIQRWTGLQKVVCLLSGNYDVEGLGEVGLRGVVTSAEDVRKIEFVDAVARECGFSVGLATLETEIEGTPDYEGRYDDWDEYGGYLESSSDEYDEYDHEYEKERPKTPDPTPSEYTMGNVDSKETRCSTLVDIRTGEIIVDDLDDVHENVSEHIPASLLDDLESDEPADEEYGGWKGNEELVEGREYVARKAIECLRGVTICQPDHKELDYVEFLLEYAKYQQRWSTDSRILAVLSQVALRWNNRELFGRVMKRCRGEEKVRRLGMDGILDAVTKFGIGYMMPVMKRILGNDVSNLDRLQLLESLGRHPASADPALATWIDERRRAVIESLAPLQKPDIVPIFAYLREHGDLATLSRTVLPLVNKFTPADAIFDLANLLHQETRLDAGSGLLKTLQDVGIASQLLSNLLSQAISNGDYFDKPKSGTINLSQGYQDLACRHIKMCLDMGCDEAVQAVLKKLSPERFSKGQRVRPEEIARYTTNIIALLPQLEPLLVKLEENRMTLHPGAAAFYNSLVIWYGNGLEYCGSNQPITTGLLKMVQLAVDAGSLSTLESLVSAIVRHVRDNGAMRALVLDLQSRLPTLATNPQTAFSFSKMIWDTLMGIISRNVHPSSTLAGILELVDFCLDVQHFRACVEILRRMHLESSRMDKNALSNVLLPLLPEVWSRFAQRGIGLYGPETGLLAVTSLHMSNGFYKASIGWKQTRDDGLKFLSAVPGGDMFWLQILGNPGYRSLLQKLDVVSINPRPPLNPSTIPNAVPAAPTPSTAPKRPHSQIQSSSQLAPHTPNRSDSAAKRPRLSNNQNITVIDLTSP